MKSLPFVSSPHRADMVDEMYQNLQIIVQCSNLIIRCTGTLLKIIKVDTYGIYDITPPFPYIQNGRLGDQILILSVVI